MPNKNFDFDDLPNLNESNPAHVHIHYISKSVTELASRVKTIEEEVKALNGLKSKLDIVGRISVTALAGLFAWVAKEIGGV